jgi:hypothetical protein
LKEVVDKGAQIVTQNQQDREQHNGEENNDQRKFDKALTATVRRQPGHYALLLSILHALQALLKQRKSTPGEVRTPDTLFRRQVLYPLSYWGTITL